MTTTKSPRPTAKPVSRPVGGPQKSIANAKAAKNDIALQQLRETITMIDKLEILTRDIETKFKSIDLSDFPKGDRSLMERQIELAQASNWATLIAISRAVEHAANGLLHGSVYPRDLARPKEKPTRKTIAAETIGLNFDLTDFPG
ncbi:hypothetical protein [Rhizobium sp. RU36D]|uniref:hypothetical protein n=1 Tax=Rhizobium sp. RU36D TaxID=1907415 RepID=UPI0009D85F82|nr:hypothetical protein [Rhizobium sp. RU36D]SMD16348.1 hypothetical protein SAMN05880593_12954 [Rhizobium sp. RU36D]